MDATRANPAQITSHRTDILRTVPARLLSLFRVGLIAILTVLGAGIAGCGDVGQAITRVAVGEPGPDPFTLVAGTDRQDVAPRIKPGRKSSGDTPGLYGGTHRTASCDPQQLIDFLSAHPDKAQAWAGVRRIAVGDIPGYVSRLTPVILRTDTLVTNHGFKQGAATGFPAVLQAGTGVLVDRYGSPVVKCGCGNPLTPPAGDIEPGGGDYKGTSWPGFSDRKVTTVTPRDKAKGEVPVLVLIDPQTTMGFERPAGTAGGQDGPLTAPPPEDADTGSPEPSISSDESIDPSAYPGEGIDPSAYPGEGTDPPAYPGEGTDPPIDPGETDPPTDPGTIDGYESGTENGTSVDPDPT